MGRIERKKLLLIEELNKRLLNEQSDSIICTDSSCQGTYKGPEFNNQGDIAHQFSNKMASEVGNKLKELYDKKMYSMVDLDMIKMTTLGMGTGNVVYTLEIPFIKVDQPCLAYTSFDHSGGWNHEPELERRKSELKSVLISGDSLNISKLLTTPEGLQEYWIQWRNNKIQSNCSGNDVESNKPTSKLSTIKSNDLDDFKNKIRTETFNKNIDLNSVRINMDNLTLSFNENPSSNKVLRLTLTYNTPNEKNCPSCENVIDDNKEYGATSIKSGTFENGTRIFSLIVLYPN